MKKLWIARILTVLFAVFALFLTFDAVSRGIALAKYTEYNEIRDQRVTELENELYSEYLQLEEEYSRLEEEYSRLKAQAQD